MKTLTMKQPVLLSVKPLGLSKLGKNLWETLRIWKNRSEQRRQLASLDQRMLQDIGISRADAIYEIHKSVWEK
jgi:uncharacterized protein YjiS (DUF1127 family)